MAKKKEQIELELFESKSKEQDIVEILEDRFSRYAKYIIQDRAIPDVRDGLKPVQRRILYAMYDLGMTYDKPFKKSARIVGDVIGKYHPHGDSAVYDAMVTMSQEWKKLLPLVDMQGNNGSIDDDPAAAMRYTEARLSKVTKYLMKDLDKKEIIVPFTHTFDDESIEPTLLPVSFPNILVQGVEGIATGYATKIPTHNLSEVIKATVYRIKYPNSKLENVMKYLQGADFSTGGIIQGKQGLIDAYTTGKGRVIIRSKTEYVKEKKNDKIVITEIPYGVVKSTLVESIAKIIQENTISGLVNIIDASSNRAGIRIELECDKDANKEMILQYLYKNTQLQVAYNYNMVMIIDKTPKQVGLLEILDEFIKYRKDVVYKSVVHDIEIVKGKLHILDGLLLAVANIDEVVKIIKKSKDKQDAKQNLVKKFKFTEKQVEAIVNLRLYRLTNIDIITIKNNYKELEEELNRLENIIKTNENLETEIIRELVEIEKEFGKPNPRRTVIEDEIEEIVIAKEDLIKEESAVISLSRDGYVRRVNLKSYGGSDKVPVLKEGDKCIIQQECTSLDKLLFFTSEGNYGYINIYDLQEGKWKDIGVHMNTLLKMTTGEKIVSAFIVKDMEKDLPKYVINTTIKGLVKEGKCSNLLVNRMNKTTRFTKLDVGDSVTSVSLVHDMENVLLISKYGNGLLFRTYNIPCSSFSAKGTKGMKLEKDDTLLYSFTVKENEKQVLEITLENETSKKIKPNEIEVTVTRNSKGIALVKQLKTKKSPIKEIKEV